MKKAFLILEDGTVFEGKSIGADKEIISEIVFNTSMTGYLEVLTDPSYAGQAVTMTYPLIGNYGVCYKDMESKKGWPDGFIVRECQATSVQKILYSISLKKMIFRVSALLIQEHSQRFFVKRVQ